MLTTSELPFTCADLTDLAQRILARAPDPSPRYLLLRDVLRCPPEDADLREAEKGLYASRWAAQLAHAQLPDGTWGRFHTQDARVKSPFPTSEHAIRRALALGLDSRASILQKASAFIRAHLRGEAAWTDPVEKQDHPRTFLTNIQSISAAMLALIAGDDPFIEPVGGRWAEIVACAFASGGYDPDAEMDRHQALTGVPSKRLYRFHVYYPLVILSTSPQRLAPDLERTMIDFLLHKPGGIYYICDRQLDELPRLEEKGFESWLNAQELLARFTGWTAFAPAIANALWAQRNEQGLWEWPARKSSYFPLSESWRQPGSHAIDDSVRILKLLRQCFP